MKLNPLIDELIALLGIENIIYGKDLDQKYHHVWKMDEPLKALALVMPKSTKQVSEIMKICFKNDQEVVRGSIWETDFYRSAKAITTSCCAKSSREK